MERASQHVAAPVCSAWFRLRGLWPACPNLASGERRSGGRCAASRCDACEPPPAGRSATFGQASGRVNRLGAARGSRRAVPRSGRSAPESAGRVRPLDEADADREPRAAFGPGTLPASAGGRGAEPGLPCPEACGKAPGGRTGVGALRPAGACLHLRRPPSPGACHAAADWSRAGTTMPGDDSGASSAVWAEPLARGAVRRAGAADLRAPSRRGGGRAGTEFERSSVR